MNHDYNCDNLLDKNIYNYLDSQKILISDVTVECQDTKTYNQVKLTVHRPFAMNNSLKITEIEIDL